MRGHATRGALEVFCDSSCSKEGREKKKSVGEQAFVANGSDNNGG